MIISLLWAEIYTLDNNWKPYLHLLENMVTKCALLTTSNKLQYYCLWNPSQLKALVITFHYKAGATEITSVNLKPYIWTSKQNIEYPTTKHLQSICLWPNFHETNSKLTIFTTWCLKNWCTFQEQNVHHLEKKSILFSEPCYFSFSTAVDTCRNSSPLNQWSYLLSLFGAFTSPSDSKKIIWKMLNLMIKTGLHP